MLFDMMQFLLIQTQMFNFLHVYFDDLPLIQLHPTQDIEVGIYNLETKDKKEFLQQKK